MKIIEIPNVLTAGTVLAAAMLAVAGASAQTASSPYTLSAFAGTPPAGATAPDDLAISANGKHLWVGYGNNVDTFGKGGPSTLVEYDIATGAVLKSISVPGHMDGLKINPVTGEVWATENEDGNPTLAIVDPESGAFKIYKFDPTLITGGFDDLVFVPAKGEDGRPDPWAKPDVYIVTSSQVDSTKPAVVRISGHLSATGTSLEATLPGAPASVLNVVANSTEATDVVGDPDSMTIDPAGELVLDNRSDDSLYILRNPKAPNSLLRVPLTLSGSPVEVNDTVFTISETTRSASTAGAIFITDTSANAIYVLTKPYFPSNEVYTAANVANVVGLVNLDSGVVMPIATGFKGVHGLAFSPTAVTIARAGQHEHDHEHDHE